MKQNLFATALLAGLIGFLYPMAKFLMKIQSWEVVWNPPGVGELLLCVCFGLLAVGAAIGINLRQFLCGLGVNIAGPADPPAPPPVAGQGGFVRVSLLLPSALLISLAVLAPVAYGGCSHPVPPSLTSPQALTAYQLTDAITAIGVVQSTAITLRRDNHISTATMRIVVRGTIAAASALDRVIDNTGSPREAYRDAADILHIVRTQLLTDTTEDHSVLTVALDTALAILDTLTA